MLYFVGMQKCPRDFDDQLYKLCNFYLLFSTKRETTVCSTDTLTVQDVQKKNF